MINHLNDYPQGSYLDCQLVMSINIESYENIDEAS